MKQNCKAVPRICLSLCSWWQGLPQRSRAKYSALPDGPVLLRGACGVRAGQKPFAGLCSTQTEHAALED